MPSGQPLEPFTNLVQTCQELACVVERAGQVIVMTRNVDRERRTIVS